MLFNVALRTNILKTWELVFVSSVSTEACPFTPSVKQCKHKDVYHACIPVRTLGVKYV